MQVSEEQARRIIEAVRSIKCEANTRKPPFGPPWYIIDTRFAEYEVNCPGKLLDQVTENPGEALDKAIVRAINEILSAAPAEGRGEQVVVYNEPLDANTANRQTLNSVVHVSVPDAIEHWKRTHPDREWTDEEALDQFMVINWAWLEPVRLTTENSELQ